MKASGVLFVGGTAGLFVTSIRWLYSGITVYRGKGRLASPEKSIRPAKRSTLTSGKKID
jgi:hypothetical protein